TQNLVVNARAAGPRLGKQVQAAIKGSKAGDWSVGADGTVTSGGVDLVEGEYTLESVAESGSDGMELAALDSGFLALDTRVTPELEAEDSVAEALGAHRDLISAETLATGLDFASLDGAAEVFAPEELPSGTRISVVRA
ncbi:isoleucine--tRNA ligase, partial [Burkholderia multivorans]